ncbi:MAG TPA: glycosyltransferase family 4 protein [Ramlibacter sp.]|uniref:glycosyltransferase family 4 protein n=1 Tax=Ramlibacter sp. TaxID=1917967 RepID=UPI002D69FB11|nr:glycosyltransferase family 4 protein [Ramlibacter sp.]HZY17907.1 glycosyltransferase family 4 protein [Ramlibacter sp.]
MTADTVGGVWTYAVELAGALSRRGHAVHLATMGAPLRADQRQQLARHAGVVLHESAFRLEWMADPWQDVDRAGEWLLALEREVRPQLVHLNQFAFGALPFQAPKLVVAHSCVLSWWQAVHGEPAPAEWSGYRDRVAAGLAGADLVAAPTQAMLDTLVPNYGASFRGVVLPNGRTGALFRPGAKEPAVFSAGRFWDQAKNLAALDAVATALPWPVRVAGSCTAPDGQRRLPAAVQLLGELPSQDLAREMGRASIYALPARYEPFGLSVLEAALSGCALVLGDIPSLREVWGPAAVFVPPDDHAALQAALQRLVQRPDERSRLAAAARQRALAFSTDRMLAACLEAYAGLSSAFQPTPEEELQCA